MALWAVLVREVEPLLGVKPLEWRLVTTVEGRAAADAIERITWYACRWGSEVGNRMLARGCRIKAR
jgi:hypothetical protein